MSGLQKKEIAKVLRNRITWWSMSIKRPECLKTLLNLESIKNPDLSKLKDGENPKPSDEDKKRISDFQAEIRGAVIVTGGAIASMLLGEEVNDIDVYFTSKSVARMVAQYYVECMYIDAKLGSTSWVGATTIQDNLTGGIAIAIKSQGVAGAVETQGEQAADYRYFESHDDQTIEDFFAKYMKSGAGKLKADQKPKHTVSFVSSNAISLQNGIQLIFRFIGDVDEVHKNFDFVHCTNYYSYDGGLVYRTEALQALLEKRLVYVGSLFPVAAMFRLRKFIARGYRVSAGEMVKIAYDISKLDLDKIEVLKEQLLGCDTAYFSEVISILRKEAGGRELDRTYLIGIIDRVFNDEGDTTFDQEDHG